MHTLAAIITNWIWLCDTTALFEIPSLTPKTKKCLEIKTKQIREIRIIQKKCLSNEKMRKNHQNIFREK